MSEEPGFELRSPLTRKPKRSYLVVWVFVGLVAAVTIFTVLQYVLPPELAAALGGAIPLIDAAGLRGPRWWAKEDDDRPGEAPVSKWFDR